MLKATIKKWQAGIDAYKAGNFNEAANCFKSIDDTSKILYCLGVVHFKQNNFSDAATAFGKSVRCDPFLAVSYFMQGVACHLKSDLSGANAHYDEAIQALRGHEYIDYKQLGMDYKLLLCEILFNKALCMKNNGLGVVAQLMKAATSCKAIRDEKARFRFEDTCNSIAAGSSTAQPYLVPLELMFLPPRIKAEKPPVGRSEAPPPRPTPARDIPTPSRPIPAAPTPASLPTSAAERSRGNTISSSLPASAPNPLRPRGQTTTKKLPPRPISLKLESAVITIKCYYKDRRLIQISSADPDYNDLQEKIRTKFEVEDLEVRYLNASGEIQVIRNLRDLRQALESNSLNELYLGFPGEINDFEPQPGTIPSTNSSSSSSSQSNAPSVPPKTNGFSRAASQASITKPVPLPKPATNNKPTFNQPAYNQPTFNQPAYNQPTSLQKSSSQPVKPFTPVVKTTAAATPAVTKSNNTQPATWSAATATTTFITAKPKKNAIWQECYTDEGERYFFNTETQETSWDPDIEPPPPWMVCFSDSGDKYYYNPTTDSSTWEFPG